MKTIKFRKKDSDIVYTFLGFDSTEDDLFVVGYNDLGNIEVFPYKEVHIIINDLL